MAKKTTYGRSTKTAKLKFEQRLVLFNWMLDLLGCKDFESLASVLRAPDLEGFNADGTSRFTDRLRLLFDRPDLPDDSLQSYDINIVHHWKAITSKRNTGQQVLYPKYFQYLCLLFTEIYLDKWFSDPEKLLFDLNKYVEQFNACDTPQQTRYSGLVSTGLPDESRIKAYDVEDLRKLAFWSATGSGKTLLMHIHIRQYLHYVRKYRKENQLNRIVLLTPNYGLSLQHRDEFELSGMEAELFDKDDRSLFSGDKIEIIDIHKLKEISGKKTIAVDSFEGKNLVLVDEGHRGTTGSEVGLWMEMRNKLCESGFSFEYSATFGQAVKASGNRDLEPLYAKCIVFNYSYKYFYGDGYGKEYRILNLEDDRNEQNRFRYLTACLLVFYQQQKLYTEKRLELRKFLIEKPLWIFVGGSVTKTPSKKDISDVVDILLFLSRFAKKKAECAQYLDLLMRGQSGLHDEHGNELFAGSFTYIAQKGMTGEQVFDDILHELFNANVTAALHVRQLKGGIDSEGEVALHLGAENAPFGIINVGDPSGLCKLCESHQDDLVVSDSEFAHSIFRRVNDADSAINILIGSRKFSEGWSSWRVSTMGLMNIGKNEGSQIIQLFGRGVRLKGYDFSLKRSSEIIGLRTPPDIHRLESLNVFGIHADYMRQFKEYLEDEGLKPNDTPTEFVLPVISNLGDKKLKTIKLKEGTDFKRQAPKPTLRRPANDVQMRPIEIDWYPKIKAMSSVRGQASLRAASPERGHFTKRHLAFMDIDEIFFELERLKSKRAWWNLNLRKDEIRPMLLDTRWYAILIPHVELEPRSFEHVHRWQEIAVAVLSKYCEWFYKTQKSDFEKQHLECRYLTDSDGNFIPEYHIFVEQSRVDLVNKLQELRDVIQSGQLRDLDFCSFALMFSQHLYQPLICADNGLVEVKPVSLNKGEKDFVCDLKEFYEKRGSFFKGKEMYLLRNMTRGRGIGFFESGDFYPDFILWLLANGRQYISFIEPHGMLMEGVGSDKVQFHKTIKQLEESLNCPDVILHSFVISVSASLELKWGLSKEQYEDMHVFFMNEDKANYIQKLFDRILKEEFSLG